MVVIRLGVKLAPVEGFSFTASLLSAPALPAKGLLSNMPAFGGSAGVAGLLVSAAAPTSGAF